MDEGWVHDQTHYVAFVQIGMSELQTWSFRTFETRPTVRIRLHPCAIRRYPSLEILESELFPHSHSREVA